MAVAPRRLDIESYLRPHLEQTSQMTAYYTVGYYYNDDEDEDSIQIKNSAGEGMDPSAPESSNVYWSQATIDEVCFH